MINFCHWGQYHILIMFLEQVLITLFRCSWVWTSVECFYLVLPQQATLRALRTWTWTWWDCVSSVSWNERTETGCPLPLWFPTPSTTRVRAWYMLGQKHTLPNCLVWFLGDNVWFCFFFFVWLEATTTAELKINRLNVVRGPCTGKTEIYMLCDKVQKGNWTWKAHLIAQIPIKSHLMLFFT